MMDDIGVLNSLARRKANSKHEPMHSEATVPVRYLMEAQSECEDAKQALRSVLAATDKETKVAQAEIIAMREQVSSLQAQLSSVTASKAEWEAKYGALEARPAPVVVADNSQSDEAREENVGLRIRCATLESKTTEQARMETILREQVAQRDAQITALTAVETTDATPESPLDGYEIDVLRGGDDKIRTLRVRYT